MIVSCNWLHDYVRTDLGPREVAERLTHVGLTVDSIEELPDGDARLDVEVANNRPDCLGHIGVARELAAALAAPIIIPEVTYKESPESSKDLVRVEVEDLGLCPLYVARLIRGVRVAESPEWLKRRLENVGVRPVNNIVDVTNYVMMETGQPLHAFDLARLAEKRILVRRARGGERFTAIDHTEHTLSNEHLVIADAHQAVAIAGVMGGLETEISDATTDILLEAAVFDPLNIRSTSRALGLASESSFRFERGVDPGGTDWASRRACQRMAQVAGGQVARGACAVGKPLPEPRELALRAGRLETILGIAIPAKTAADILQRLGLEVVETTAERVRVRVPSWRRDLEREVDLVEEVARHHGYEKIPQSQQIRVAYAAPTQAERVREAISEVLTAAGYFEAVTFSFTTGDRAVRFRPSAAVEPLRLRGTPLRLRESVIPGLLDSLRINQNAGEADARLFEMARRYIPTPREELPQEDAMLALASPDDFEHLKGVLEAVFSRLRVAERIRFAPTDRWPDLEPDESAEVLLDDRAIGMIGRATQETAEAFGLDDPPAVAEICFDRLVEAAVLEPAYQPLPPYPAIVRDLAIVVDESAPWADVEKTVASADVPEVESVQLVDVYRGEQIPTGKKSVALRLVLRSAKATLTHEQADAVQAKVLGALQDQLGAVLRS